MIIIIHFQNNASYILEANVEFNDVVVYEGGEEILIPIFDTIEDDSTQPPWKRGGRGFVKICNNILKNIKVFQKCAVVLHVLEN